MTERKDTERAKNVKESEDKTSASEDKASEHKASEHKASEDKAKSEDRSSKREGTSDKASKPKSRFMAWLPRLWGNWTSLLGLTLMCLSGNALLIVYIVDIAKGGLNAYVSALAYVGLPPVLLIGLGLALLGAWRQGKRIPAAVPGGLLANKKTRRRLLFVIGGTFINLTVISFFAYRGVSYMQSTGFCSSACHVMQPQAVAHQAGAHLRIACPDCHVKPGAKGAVQAKLSGMRQLWGVVTNEFSRPVPTPVKHLPEAKYSCNGCHPGDKWRSTAIRIVPRFKSDEKNSYSLTVLRLNVGGLDPNTASYKGIHWHASPDTKVQYEVLDKKRKLIGRVFVTTKGSDGKSTTRTYAAPKKLAGKKVLEKRTMDCSDCHNRVGHPFARSPERAVDILLYYRKIDPSLPFVRKQALALVKGKLPKGAKAGKHYLSALTSYYGKKHPKVAKDKAKQISDAAAALGRLYDRNVFPFMKVGWGSYQSHRGHPEEDSKKMFGCFRCHDDNRKTKDGKKTIGQDCDTCHEQLVEDEAKPTISPEILKIGRP